MFKNYTKRLYSTKNDTRINEIIQLISDTKTFEIALTHKSYVGLDPTAKNYNTLEFLGDAILEFYTTLFLFNSYPELTEGKLTDKRTQLVEGKNLASISLKIGLHNYLRMAPDQKSIDFNSKSLSKGYSKMLGDIFESFIAALYLEKGENLLNEFLRLTVLDRPEFNKLFKLNSQEAKIIVPTPAIGVLDTDFIINSSDDIKDKFSNYMDESLNNQKRIIELLSKNFEFMRCNS